MARDYAGCAPEVSDFQFYFRVCSFPDNFDLGKNLGNLDALLASRTFVQPQTYFEDKRAKFTPSSPYFASKAFVAENARNVTFWAQRKPDHSSIEFPDQPIDTQDKLSKFLQRLAEGLEKHPDFLHLQPSGIGQPPIYSPVLS